MDTLNRLTLSYGGIAGRGGKQFTVYHFGTEEAGMAMGEWLQSAVEALCCMENAIPMMRSMLAHIDAAVTAEADRPGGA